MPPDGRSERPERSEGRERSPEGAYTMRLTSAEGASSVLYRASEDGSKRPERSEGLLRSPVGAYTCIQSPVGVSRLFSFAFYLAPSAPSVLPLAASRLRKCLVLAENNAFYENIAVRNGSKQPPRLHLWPNMLVNCLDMSYASFIPTIVSSVSS